MQSADARLVFSSCNEVRQAICEGALQEADFPCHRRICERRINDPQKCRLKNPQYV